MQKTISGTPGMDDRTRVICRSRNGFAGRRLAEISRMVHADKGPIRKGVCAVQNAWAMLWAVTAGGCWVEMGERLGLWMYVGPGKEKRDAAESRPCMSVLRTVRGDLD